MYKDMWLFWFLLISLAAATTTSTSTTITTTTINWNAMFVYSFNIPFFAIGLLLLAFGLVYIRSKNISLSLLVSSLVSFILIGNPINLIDISICGVLVSLFVLSFIFHIFAHKKEHAGGVWTT